MRNYLPWWVITVFFVVVSGCIPVDNTQEEIYPGYVNISREFWRFEHDTPYPFTVNGELSCEDHPFVGKAVFFNPEGYTNEFYIGTPLNEAAKDLLDLLAIYSNVPNPINTDSDLQEIINIGIRLCNQKY